MTRNVRTTVHRAALALARCCDAETLAGVLNGLVCCDAEPSLSDAAVDVGGTLFDLLCDLRPDARALAVGAVEEEASARVGPAGNEDAAPTAVVGG